MEYCDRDSCRRVLIQPSVVIHASMCVILCIVGRIDSIRWDADSRV